MANWFSGYLVYQKKSVLEISSQTTMVTTKSKEQTP